MPGVLYNKLKAHVFVLQRVDFDRDWKVITMFVGGNDICDYCTDSVSTPVIINTGYIHVGRK